MHTLFRRLPLPLRVLLISSLGGAAMALIILLAIAQAVYAADVPAGTVVDLGPTATAVLSAVAPLVFTALSTVALWVLGRVARWLGLGIDERHRKAIDQALAHAVAFATERLGDRAKGGILIDMKSGAIAAAITYAQRAVPDALKHFRIDDDRLREMVEARLDGLVVDPSIPASDMRLVRVAAAPAA